jgi:hypothetical protein
MFDQSPRDQLARGGLGVGGDGVFEVEHDRVGAGVEHLGQ